MTTTIDARVVSLAVNLPGPLAACRLAQLGATVTKVEPPGGDPLASAAPGLYRKLHRGQTVCTLDLKSAQGSAALDELLAHADLLITSMRPRALANLGLTWDRLHARFPRLCHVAIVGFPPPGENRPGHDLLYQAVNGLLEPPHLPSMLVADFAGGERAVSAALALLLARAQTGTAAQATVALAQAAADCAEPLGCGLTAPGGPLRGALSGYALYQTRSGWIAVAALEETFVAALKRALGIESLTQALLQEKFQTRTAAEWEKWGRQHDIPIAAVADPKKHEV